VGEVTADAVAGTAVETPGIVIGCETSARVMVSPDGILWCVEEPFRFLLGPVCSVGEACLDRFRGVIVADVAWEFMLDV